MAAVSTALLIRIHKMLNAAVALKCLFLEGVVVRRTRTIFFFRASCHCVTRNFSFTSHDAAAVAIGGTDVADLCRCEIKKTKLKTFLA